MTGRRIDVHQHIVPPFYAEWLRTKPGAGALPIPTWSEEAALELMGRCDIQTAVVSVSTPGCHFGDDAEARSMARELNEYTADVVRRHPGRFGFFATVPAPDVDGAILEATYAIDKLGANGVVLLANVDGKYLGEPELDPLFAELDRRRAVVFLHPSTLPGPGLAGLPAFAVDFLLDTTRAAANLVRNGVIERFPNVRIILSHAGGFVPYAAQRIAVTLAFVTQRSLDDVLADLRSFYFDTALSSPTALPSLLAFASPGHVFFGSDWPYAPTPVAKMFTNELDGFVQAGSIDRAPIDRESALRLFPGFAT